ncbi:Predicted metalloprotease [Amycolatopsis arida]|uniref:Predicted metalloprotease n=1 Tax=Amycolatopsis arida TaxID=587909 RepID=A0A1I5PAL6_9PSEU|nr:hypothetical protein [Amycolatopsis arida]TDX98427.1 putative metalloprotease [Amycolatopsis arida]SFP31129.1 Predicted metalloprotease [Amycolatopsis arida]
MDSDHSPPINSAWAGVAHNERVGNRAGTAITAMLACAALAAGCASVAGRAAPSGSIVADTIRESTVSLVDPGFVRGGDDGAIDRLAATAVADVEAFWRRHYPEVFGQPWRELAGGFVSVDTADPRAEAPPCTDSAALITGNAYYCPAEDVVVWDRAALLPVLAERYGAPAVTMVLAHEMGHAVQHRAGVTGARQPTIVIEAMADCYAGAFLRWVADGSAEHLRLSPAQLDPTLRALVTFRDPVGTDDRDAGAHGGAFDRVSAFLDGYAAGAATCARITADNREFTQRAFTSADDLERGGNLPLPELLPAMARDLGDYFTEVLRDAGTGWSPPPVEAVDAAPGCLAGAQGAVAFCPGEGVRVWPEGMVADIHAGVGDYGTGVLLASRYALGVLHATGRPVAGPDAQRAVLCLAGAYTGSLLRPRRDFTVSPGDLDEAVQVLLGYDYPARDAHGGVIGAGFERVATFREGVLGGAGACGLG